MEEREKRKLHEKGENRTIPELRDAIQAGIDSGPGVSAQEVFDRLEKKYTTSANGRNG